MGFGENAILDWCLTNTKKTTLDVSKAPLGLSDHDIILIKSFLNKSPIHGNRSILERDLRDSNLRLFGQWITAYDCDDELISLAVNYSFSVGKLN